MVFGHFSRSLPPLLFACFACCLLTHPVAADYNSLKKSLFHIKNDLRAPVFSALLGAQDQLIELAESVARHFQTVHDGAPPGLNSAPNSSAAFCSQAHVDVFMVGFSASVTSYFSELWLEPLDRRQLVLEDDSDDEADAGDDDSEYSSKGGSGGHRSGVYRRQRTFLGPPCVESRLHTVQLSFRVAEAISERAALLLRPTHRTVDNRTVHYINSWEMEDLLDSLHASVFFTANRQFLDGSDIQERLDFEPTAAKIFLLNINPLDRITGQELLYEYRDGFSDSDLELLANHAQVVEQCRAIVRSAKRASRLTLDASKGSLKRRNDAAVFDLKPTPFRNKDGVESSRNWADKISSETKVAEVCSTNKQPQL